MPEQCQGSYVCIVNVNNNLGYYITSADDFSHTLIGEVRNNITLNSKITLGQYTRVLFMNIPKSKDGALLAIAPGDKIITAFRNNGVWEENSSHFIATKSDLTDNLNHKKQILPWSTYRDGNYPISNFKFGLNLYIAVGASSKVQKRCSIMAANDSIQIPHPEGFITIVFNDTNHITVSGTTNNYQLREIRASDLFGI